VGQSEIEALQLTDFFLLLMLSGAGDELQGIKRGIMETADGIIITKADGDNVEPAKRAAQEYRRALHLMPPHEGEWRPKVGTASSPEGKGIDTVLSWMQQYKDLCAANGYWKKKRTRQAVYWFEQNIQQQILGLLRKNDNLKQLLDSHREDVANLKKDPFQAVDDVTGHINININ
jgi:LAO/AO transport system kinase